jgi:hypothetical protein
MPELELGQTPDKRTELIVLIRGKAAYAAIFKVVGFESGVEFRLEEREKEVEEIDANRVCDYRAGLAGWHRIHERGGGLYRYTSLGRE